LGSSKRTLREARASCGGWSTVRWTLSDSRRQLDSEFNGPERCYRLLKRNWSGRWDSNPLLKVCASHCVYATI